MLDIKKSPLTDFTVQLMLLYSPYGTATDQWTQRDIIFSNESFDIKKMMKE